MSIFANRLRSIRWVYKCINEYNVIANNEYNVIAIMQTLFRKIHLVSFVHV